MSDGSIGSRQELARKGLHLLSAAAPLAYAAGLGRTPLVWALAGLLTAALIVELGRARSVRLRAAFHRATGPVLRTHEHTRWSGATWLLAAFFLAAVLLDRSAAIAAMWAVSVGDAAAAIVGRLGGRHPVPGTGKSVEGSAACFVATFAGALLVARLDAATATVAALFGTAAELLPLALDDNIRVAVAVGTGILLWRLSFS